MDKEYIKIFVKNVDTQLFEIVSNLICSICQELYNKPVTTPCGHSFCNGCIKRVLSSRDNSGCPLCKSSVKRYSLEEDAAKSSLINILKDLPAAFGQDVEDLTKNHTNLGGDLVKTSKLFQICNQENSKEASVTKQRVNKRKTKKVEMLEQAEHDSGSFVPVLKRTKNVLEYASAKKKRLDDLVSISQTEAASNSSLCESSELDKKLKNIEKIPSEKKVNEWFKAVGDNFYINSPSSSILEPESKIILENETKKEPKPSMIRIDYIKSKVSSENEDDVKAVDPYEFVPSQNNNICKKKRQRRLSGKKIPDFKALQSFSKESVKRNAILLDDGKDEIGAEEEVKDTVREKQVTASQKFEELLIESKKEEKKPHALYSASQSSSPQFLDVSYHSKIGEKLKKKKSSKVGKNHIDPEDVLFKNVEVIATRGKEERSCRAKRRRSASTPKSGKKNKLFAEIIEMKSDEASELEGSVEKYLIKRSKKVNRSRTKLKELLMELLDDDIIYATRPPNAPVRLPEVVVDTNTKSLKAGNTITQNTELIGFCTQEETPYEKNFKEMVKTMEKELNSSEYLTEKSDNNVIDCQTNTLEDPKTGATVGEEKQKPEETSEISKMHVVEFLHLGRLTPIRKRAKSSVVKLVFPIGLASLARRHASESRCIPVTKKQTCQVSTGIQTSHETVSCLVQTSQVPQSSFNMQTSQEVRPSVEIQTTQKGTTTAGIQTTQRGTITEGIQTTQRGTATAGIQTTQKGTTTETFQRFVSQEIQTSQTMCESAQVQTTQLPFSLDSNPNIPQTPLRKPSHEHRKIIQRRNSIETPFNSPPQLFPPDDESPVKKDIIMDFGVEKEFDETWRNTHTNLVAMKNKKNKKLTGTQWKAPDEDSDDSDVIPPRRKSTYRIFSQEANETPESRDTRQLTSLNVKKINEDADEDVEVINLDTPRSQNSAEQMLRVLKNIDMDLPKGKSGSVAKGEKSEESDSDFFVEQTPPRPTSRAFDDIKNISRSRQGLNFGQKQSKGMATEIKENLENCDLIADSLPKGFSESFLLPTAPQRIPLSPEKNPKDEPVKKISKIEPTKQVDLPDENDQNQMNAFEGRTKLKTTVDAWKQSETVSIGKTTPVKKLCVVASSVKNSDLIKKFVNKFKIEYSNKPTKDMTHLIVGLHENEDKEVLPLCTPKLLFAMANKKWVVSELWAETCLKMNIILPEETFETLDPVGGCGCRKARLSNEKLLKNCEIYLLGDFQMISKEEFADLISDCGGSLVPTPDKFTFLSSKLRMIIADRDCVKLNEKQLQDLYQKHSTVILSRDVIIMSIQSYKLVNFYPYLLHVASEEHLLKLGYPLHLVKNDDEEDEEGS